MWWKFSACLLWSLPAILLAAEPQALFNGKDLSGWTFDVIDPDVKPEAIWSVEEGLLVCKGKPPGVIRSAKADFSNYELTVEWRWPGKPGNCGVLVHSSTPRRLYEMFPQSIECQLHVGNAGDFWCIGEDVTVPDMEKRRGPKANWGVDGDKARRIVNLCDGAEKPLGEWNRMVIECRGDSIRILVNDTLANHGTGCTAKRGAIALQAEGAVCEFRKVELQPLPPDAK